MGRELFRKLGFSINDGEGNHICHVQVNSLKAKYPGLFREVPGALKGYMHKIRLKPGSAPVVHKLRRVPFAIRDAVSEELKALETAGIIERIDGSEWVHPIVPVVKPSGKIRLCVDLRNLNENVVMDQHAMHTMEDMLSDISLVPQDASQKERRTMAVRVSARLI